MKNDWNLKGRTVKEPLFQTDITELVLLIKPGDSLFLELPNK